MSAPLIAGGEPRIELIGHLTALLRAGGAEGLPVIRHAKSPLAVANSLVCLVRHWLMRGHVNDAGGLLPRPFEGLVAVTRPPKLSAVRTQSLQAAWG